MAVDPREKARETLRRAQAEYEQDAAAVKEARQRAFAEAKAAGLSLREIAKEVGLHYSRVSEILRGK
ncbi:MAG: helix-turn-helix domain-containing protein [Actinobacteria bacterium]|nr:helix-turn-helix domain-containing protein [Actinomycetota bacterium]